MPQAWKKIDLYIASHSGVNNIETIFRKVSSEGIIRKGVVGIQQKSELQNFPNCFPPYQALLKILKLVLLLPFFASFLGKQKRRNKKLNRSYFGNFTLP
jgi:hypothetical protein